MQRHPGLGHPGSSRPPQKRPARAGERPLRVLFVDADEDRRDLIGVEVGVLGHRADEARSTRQALLALTAVAYDVVIVDDETPGFDALEVTELLLAATRPARRRPAVVVVSAGLDLPGRLALFRAGVVEVVSRPLSLAPLHGLLVRIDRALSG